MASLSGAGAIYSRAISVGAGIGLKKVGEYMYDYSERWANPDYE